MRNYLQRFLSLIIIMLLSVIGIVHVRALIGGGRGGGGPANNAGHSSRQPFANGNGLVAWYNMDGSANDSGPNGLNGTLVGTPVASTGKFGGVYSFNANSGISLGNPAALQLSTGTLSTWVLEQPSQSYAYVALIDKPTAYLLITDQTGHLGAWDPSVPTFRNSGKVISDGVWHHVVMTFQSGVTNGTQIWLDGVSVLTTTTTVVDQTTTLYLGYQANSQFLNGTLDDVRMYNRVLSSAEISQLYAGSQPPPIDQTLAAYWKLDETSGTTVTDSIGGTVSNAFVGAPKPVAGVYSGGYSFNGSTDYITVPDTAGEDFAGATAISGEAWIYATSGNTSTIVGKGSYASAIGYEFTLNSVGGLNGISLVLNTANIHPYYLNSTYSMPLNTWTHVAFTYNSALAKAYLYINGVKAAIKDNNSTSPSGALLSATGKMTYIGRRDPDTGNTFFPGKIDDIRLYTRTLTDAEVYDHYLAGR
jgi:hypothetical protein